MVSIPTSIYRLLLKKKKADLTEEENEMLNKWMRTNDEHMELLDYEEDRLKAKRIVDLMFWPKLAKEEKEELEDWLFSCPDNYKFYKEIRKPKNFMAGIEKLCRAEYSGEQKRMNSGYKPIKIFLVDDHLSYLEVLNRYLNKNKGLEVVGRATSGKEAIEMLNLLIPFPDIVIMDDNMPGLDGYETARQLIELYPSIKILINSFGLGPDRKQELLQIGVQGAISKTSAENIIVNAIETVISGNVYVF